MKTSGGTPATEVVVIGTTARQLQYVLSDAKTSKAQLIEAERLCMEIHKASCAVLAWIAKEEKHHE